MEVKSINLQTETLPDDEENHRIINVICKSKANFEFEDVVALFNTLSKNVIKINTILEKAVLEKFSKESTSVNIQIN